MAGGLGLGLVVTSGIFRAAILGMVVYLVVERTRQPGLCGGTSHIMDR